MSLAARCPACGTAFRVVPDQLRVSDGWVRCGRCQEVFNANKTLFDLRGAAPATGRTTPPGAASSSPPTTPSTAPASPPLPPARTAAVARPSTVPSITVGGGVAAPLAPTDVDLSTPGWNDPGPAPRVPLDIDALHASLFGALPTESAPPGDAIEGPGEATPPSPSTEATAVPEPTSSLPVEPSSGTAVDDDETAEGPAHEIAADGRTEAVSPFALATAAPYAPGDAVTGPREDEDSTSVPPPEDDASPAAVAPQATSRPSPDEAEPPPSTNTLAPLMVGAVDDERAAPTSPPDRGAHEEALLRESPADHDASSPGAMADEADIVPATPSWPPAHDATAETREPGPVGPAESVDATTEDAGAMSAERSAQAPSFVRQAERAARWRSPGMRVLLFVAALALSAAAVLQAVGGFHDAIVERWPVSRAVVQALCSVVGCELQARRQLESLSVEGSGLSELDGGERVRLSLVLRNRARAERLLPSIELTLSDAQGATVARRVFTAAELGAAAPTIAGGAELSLQAVLDVGGARVAGYALDLFYP